MNPEQEEQLVAEAKRDPAAFGVLFEKYHSQIFNYMLRRTADVALADDLTAEVFFKALQNLKRFQWRNLPFSAWLYRIATNAINGHFRRQRFKFLPIDSTANNAACSRPGTEQEIEEAQERLQQYRLYLQAHKLLLQLPLRYQEVISLRFFENKKIYEISLILDKREGTVKSLLSRGLKQLQQKLSVLPNEAVQPFPGTGILKGEDPNPDNPLTEKRL